MEDRRLFADIPEDFTGVTDEDLAGLLAAHLEAVNKIVAQDPEFLGDLDAKTILDQMDEGVEAVERIKAELDVRESAKENFEAGVAERAAKVKPAEELAQADTEEPDSEESNNDDDSGDEPVVAEAEVEEPVAEAAEELEPVLASAPVVRRRLPKPSAQHQTPAAPETPGFVAAAGIPGYTHGHRFESQHDMAVAMVRASEAVSTPPGFRQDVVVASVDYRDQYPEDRRLVSKMVDQSGNDTWDAIQRVVRPNGNLVAAGGVCAPVTPYYGQQFIATVDRPVRDALVGFNADRGGINFNPPVGIGTITGSDAIGIVTEEEDAEGGTFAAKTCLTVVCVAATEVDVDIIYHCVTWSNLTARTFPERVAQFSDTVMAGWARLAETNLLNGIKANSTNVTQANTNLQGAASSLLGSVLAAAAGQRSRQRMRPDATLRALFPAWSRDLLIADIVRSQFQRFDMTEAGLVALLRSYNIEPSFYIDSSSTGSQVFGAQGAGALLAFPTTVEWALFPEGSHLFLDGGVLELGIVRDSVLNAENQFQIFGESFESTAFVGIESLWITTTVCPSGTVALPIDNSDFC